MAAFDESRLTLPSPSKSSATIIVHDLAQRLGLPLRRRHSAGRGRCAWNSRFRPRIGVSAVGRRDCGDLRTDQPQNPDRRRQQIQCLKPRRSNLAGERWG